MMNFFLFFQQQQPNISMGPSSGKQYDPLEELESLEPSRQSKPAITDAKKDKQEKLTDKKQSNTSGSWFGGLFSKLAPKPKNQMILPDDSNPAVSSGSFRICAIEWKNSYE